MPHPLRHDAAQYTAYAVNILHHGVYSLQPYQRGTDPEPDSVRPPGYPFFLTAVLLFSPKAPVVAIQDIQVMISIATIFLSYVLFVRFIPAIPALAATFLVAISPHLVILNVYLLTETLFTFALLGSLVLCVHAYEQGTGLYAFLTGAAFGGLTLIRSAVEYFVLVAAAILRKEGLSGRLVLLCLLGFAMVFGSWSVRNLVSTGELADNTLMIKFLHAGMYPGFMYKGRRYTYGYPSRIDPESTAIEESVPSVVRTLGERFLERPKDYLRWFLVGKPVTFWQWNIVQGRGDIYVYPVEDSPYFSKPVFQFTHLLAKLLHIPLIVLGLLGSLLCWLPWSPHSGQGARLCVRMVAGIIVYYQLLHIVGAPFPRYSVPLRPLIYGMAMYFVYSLYVWIAPRLWSQE